MRQSKFESVIDWPIHRPNVSRLLPARKLIIGGMKCGGGSGGGGGGDPGGWGDKAGQLPTVSSPRPRPSPCRVSLVTRTPLLDAPSGIADKARM
jgi:hypothetical protein